MTAVAIEVHPIECPQCGNEIEGTRPDGLYADGEQIKCGCGVLVQVSIGDGIDHDYAYVGRWWCKHGLDDETECAPCEAEHETVHLGFDHSLKEIECVRDDVTECDCPRCVAAEDDFWRLQEGELEMPPHPDDCDDEPEPEEDTAP